MAVGQAMWSEAEEARLREVFPVASRDDVLAAFPGRRWESLRKKGEALGLRRDRSIVPNNHRPKISPEFLEPVEQYLAEWRTLDYMEPRSIREGWRDVGAIAVATGLVLDRVCSACERLADDGVLEVRCGESGWVFYRKARKA